MSQHEGSVNSCLYCVQHGRPCSVPTCDFWYSSPLVCKPLAYQHWLQPKALRNVNKIHQNSAEGAHIFVSDHPAGRDGGSLDLPLYLGPLVLPASAPVPTSSRMGLLYPLSPVFPLLRALHTTLSALGWGFSGAETWSVCALHAVQVMPESPKCGWGETLK